MQQSDMKVEVHRQADWGPVRVTYVQRSGLGRQERDHVADTHSLFLNVRGVAKTGGDRIDGTAVPFVSRREGSLTYLPPYRRWQGWDEGDERAAHLLISVESEFADRLTGASILGELSPEIGFLDLPIQFAARRIAREIDNDDDASAMMVAGFMTSIFAHLIRRRSRKRQSVYRRDLSSGALRRSLALIEASIDKPLSLQELATAANLSLSHFCHAFKATMGLPPHRYLDQCRLEKASELLRAGKVTITQIAFTCGYSSASHFSKKFSDHLGVSPSIYRRLWLEQIASAQKKSQELDSAE